MYQLFVSTVACTRLSVGQDKKKSIEDYGASNCSINLSFFEPRVFLRLIPTNWERGTGYNFNR